DRNPTRKRGFSPHPSLARRVSIRCERVIATLRSMPDLTPGREGRVKPARIGVPGVLRGVKSTRYDAGVAEPDRLPAPLVLRTDRVPGRRGRRVNLRKAAPL